MYLKSLTLKGFKSFAQPTALIFEPGVTCIVGPNGSGKSNVVDALAWVMGEQGAKTLRGGKMEDVIFAGTATRGPLGRAEVSLTIDNTDGALPIEYTEVTISRTLFRSGQSEYAINGEQCRLLDVQELLSDSGLGREMHVIVGQGRLDSVLHASPEDRRGFIEEAAGILKHRRRKEKTLRKLDAMQANFTRLNDLSGELRRQLKPLGKQAEVARKAAGVAAILRDAKARLLADELTALRHDLSEHGRNEHERHAERLVLQDQLEQNEQRLARLEAEQGTEEIDQIRATNFALEQAQGQLRSLEHLVGQRMALLSANDEPTAFVPTVSQSQIANEKNELEALQNSIAATVAAYESANQEAGLRRSELDSVDEEIARQSALVSAYDLQLSQLAGKVEAAQQRTAAANSEVDRHRAALEGALERQSQALAAKDIVEAEDAEQGETAYGLDQAHNNAQAEVTRIEGELEEIRDKLHVAEREHGGLLARVQALSLALDQRDGSAELIAANLPGVIGLVAENLNVVTGYEAAIATALGTAAEGVLVTDHPSAYAALAATETEDLGHVVLAVANPTDSHQKTPEIEKTEIPGLVLARDVITAPPGILNLLDEVVIAEDLESVRELEPLLANLKHRVTVITRSGNMVGRFIASGGSTRVQSRIELLAERDAANASLTVAQKNAETARTALANQREALTVAKAQAKAALQKLREQDNQLAARAERLNRARAQAEAALAETERLSSALVSAEERVTNVAAELDSAIAAHALQSSQARPVLDASPRDEALMALDQARAAAVEAKLAVETTRERVRAQQVYIANLERQYAAEQKQAEEVARRAVIRRAQLAAATRVATVLPLTLTSVDASVAEARTRLVKAETERSGRNQEVQLVRREEAQLRERLQALTEIVHGLELRIYEKRLHANSLIERAESELGLTEEVLITEYGPEVDVPPDQDEANTEVVLPRPYVREEQQKRLRDAEKLLAQMGQVNPLALEEFAALEQRHLFLTEQLNDLQRTRKDLLTIIEEIDTKMETIFVDAFNDTKAAFAEVFPILFPGGIGSISLTDPNDMLATGIEVSVKPAGKKIERLSLLSGGERSLAATALLMAIFKARPSPFYIMDEVEAALDDANLGRLLTTFQSLRADSQLIVITHQKRTMEIADALYGVSMRQDGVSAVIGQRVREEIERAS